jgi:hypothetical protein
MLGLVTLDFKKLDSWRAHPENFREADFQAPQDSGSTCFSCPRWIYPRRHLRRVRRRTSPLGKRLTTPIRTLPSFVSIVPGMFLSRAKAEKRGSSVSSSGQQKFQSFPNRGRTVDAFYRADSEFRSSLIRDNALGGGSVNPAEKGLTGYGAQVLARMNQLRRCPPITSHCGDRTTLRRH